MIEILSENRDLKPYVKEAEKMLTQVNIERLPSYELGTEKVLDVGSYNEQLRLARKLLDLLSDVLIAERTGFAVRKRCWSAQRGRCKLTDWTGGYPTV